MLKTGAVIAIMQRKVIKFKVVHWLADCLPDEMHRHHDNFSLECGICFKNFNPAGFCNFAGF
jgi:hypothetical protein